MQALTPPREKPVRIGAKVAGHGQYVTFRMAEVTLPRDLFRKILRLIDQLCQGQARHEPRSAAIQGEIDGRFVS